MVEQEDAFLPVSLRHLPRCCALLNAFSFFVDGAMISLLLFQVNHVLLHRLVSSDLSQALLRVCSTGTCNGTPIAVDVPVLGTSEGIR